MRLLAGLLFSLSCFASSITVFQIKPVLADPSGSCPTPFFFQYNSSSSGGLFWGCKNGTWTPITASVAIGGAVVGGTSKSVLFVDASGNLAQDNANFNYDSTGPLLTVNNAGNFNNTVTKYPIAGTLAGCSPSTQYDNVGFGAGAHGDFGIAGCAGPSTGSTQTNIFGSWGSIIMPDNGSDAVAGGFFAMASGNGTGTSTAQRVRLWGINPLCEDKGFTHVICQNELDFNVTGTDTLAFGISIVGASTVAPVAGSAAISIGRPGPTVNWPLGVVINEGATGSNAAVYLAAQHAADSMLHNSQKISFASYDASNVAHTASIIEFTDGGIGLVNDIENTTSGTVYFIFGGTTEMLIQHNGGISQTGVAFASLGTPANGTWQYCNNCTVTASCGSGGGGALAKRLGGAWVCN